MNRPIKLVQPYFVNGTYVQTALNTGKIGVAKRAKNQDGLTFIVIEHLNIIFNLYLEDKYFKYINDYEAQNN